ncbi:uncharacterized protein At5g39865 [Diospyros lotus]|uniref:uncharacterized protein At5g39865 n=1 Tax=Diospyros lotus TaxID=55363 RepID=UPI0022557465|nr:uncharacterized protein At5g39865 [Diospyros lotus]
MWLPRAKSTARIRSHPACFSCSSFKDIQNLLSEDFNNSSSNGGSQIKSRPSIFHRVRIAKSILRAWSAQLPHSEPALPQPEPEPEPEPEIYLPGSENRVVVYFTSLRVVRSTFQDCNAVRSILRGFRVSVDERDVSMDARFMDELQRIMGRDKGKLRLPRVFVGGKYIGGADEIWQLHEAGELKKLVEGLHPAEVGVCEVCGGYRFILCDECSGSRKLFSEKGGFRTCAACNENGLIRCPSCSCDPL